MKLWEDKYVEKMHSKQTSNGLILYHEDKWGAVLYVEDKSQFFKEPQRLYPNEEEYLKAIKHLLNEDKGG